ncbi:DUF362 domain-containing protein [Alkaliphilus transvaalensis]|uniref:DUF362 domain-containing protein n=1 Tax=Alkaliphilus transvaalensis TaxID=114628 RepID=UPI00047DF3B7|nr:DUF362 domain-containing protein [Alkaliphilus transvaalensis]
MKNVYFIPIDSYFKTEEINQSTKLLLEKIVEDEEIPLERYIPLKVHFGEKGNKTFIGPQNFNGIIDFLNKNEIDSGYIETNVLYRGERMKSSSHIQLAKDHHFTQLPIVIADGDHGEAFENISIDGKHFKTCKIAKGIATSNQLIVVSHFKGHMLAGFGGAIKQLAMGCASKGGKLDQHANSIPKVSYFKCKACNVCVKNCPENAIVLGKKAKIQKDKCVGCAACVAHCPFAAISNSWVASISNNFGERLAEYAYGAAKNKRNIYITFAFNITRGCDCEPHSMKPIVKDLGLLASTDAVAIDQAALDLLDKYNGKTVFRRGRKTLAYAEKIGLGSRNYSLIEL